MAAIIDCKNHGRRSCSILCIHTVSCRPLSWSMLAIAGCMLPTSALRFSTYCPDQQQHQQWRQHSAIQGFCLRPYATQASMLNTWTTTQQQLTAMWLRIADEGSFVNLQHKHNFTMAHFGMMLGMMCQSLQGTHHLFFHGPNVLLCHRIMLP